jgi:hypothetical protein
LAKKNTDQLEKAARESNVRVDCQVKGVSRDASNKVIIAHLLKKKEILQLHPSLGTSFHAEQAVIPSKFSMNDKFHRTSVIFLDKLSDLAIRGEDTVTCAELGVGLVGHKSEFLTMPTSHFNEGFLPDSVDGMTFGDLLHQFHPIFLQNETNVWAAIKNDKVKLVH